jgi:agmatinase
MGLSSFKERFLGLTDEECHDLGGEGGGSPCFSILSAPYDLTTTYMSGASKGPEAIIDASVHLELYDEEQESEPFRCGIETLPPIKLDGLNTKDMVEAVRLAGADVLERERVPVLLGGEHSVTLGLVKALKTRYSNLSVLQFDAHTDLRDSYNNDPLSHASVIRRVSELCPVTQLGIRSTSAKEAAFLKQGGSERVTTIYAPEVLRDNNAAAERALSSLSDDVYITFDLDSLDPSIMPSTGTPEPGGLGWYDVINILRTIVGKKNIVGFDVVELAPRKGEIAPDFLAAKLVYKIMGFMATKKIS